ncbi:anoctamin-like protein Os01g0706700 isoform X5 [Arachis hypogaea]|uniref:anoctamin-like protein Os01g0706700 isoform X5 n=2 Tax=Arachis TaxID=3817 RepID=UPI003B21A624
MVENVAVRIELSNGSVGWGEAPILPFVTAEDQKTAMAKASEACAFLRRCPSLTLGSMLEDIGNSDEFFKVAAPLETLGRAAAELRIMKRTRIGMDLQFDMVEVDAFVKQPDGLLFSWYECFQCYCRLMHGIVREFSSAPCFLHCGHTMGYYVFSVLETEKCFTFSQVAYYLWKCS